MSTSSAAPTLRRPVRSALIECALVVVGFTLLAILLTWPTAAHANTILSTQLIPWDPAGFVWDLWQRLQEGLPLFGTGTTELVAPFTIEYPAAFNLVQLAFYGPAVAVAAITTPVFAMNVMIISGIAFSGMAMYALARWLGCGAGASTWAGAALAIAPYVVGKAGVHAMMVNVAAFPLLILAGLWWIERPNWKRALAVTGAFGLAWTTTAYFGLIATVIVIVLCGWGLITQGRTSGWRSSTRSGGALGAMLAVLVLVPIAISVLSSNAPTPARTSAELSVFGALPADYVTPPPGAWLARGIDASWTGRSGGTGEQYILYIGISVLVVAIVAMVIAWWRPTWLGSARAVTTVRVMSVLAPVLAWFSLAWPIDIGPVRLPVPSIAIWQVAPEFRAFARFGVAVLVVLLVCAGVLIAALARRGGPIWHHSIIAAALIITWADLGTALPVDSSPPASPAGQPPADWPIWAWLRDAPQPGAVVEYPVGPDVHSAEMEMTRRYWTTGQVVHGRALLDGTGPMGQAPDPRVIDLGRQVADPTMPGTAEDLATAGVVFATVNPWRYAQTGAASPDLATPPKGFTAATAPTADAAIWQVTAAPQPALAVFRQPGFSGPTAHGASAEHRMLLPTAIVTVWAPQQGEYRLVFPVRSTGGARVTATPTGSPPGRAVPRRGSLTVTVAAGPTGRDIVMSSLHPTDVTIGRPEVIRG